MARAQDSRVDAASTDLKIGGMVNQDYTQAVQRLCNSVSVYSLAHAEADEEFSVVCRDFKFLFPPQGDVGQDGSTSGSQVIGKCRDKIKKYNELYDLQVKILSLDKELGSSAQSEPVGISAVAFAWISSWWDSTATAQPGLRERHAKAQREAQYPVKIRKNLRNVFFWAIVLTGIVVTTFIFIATLTARYLLAALAGSQVILPILAVFFLMLVLSSRAYPQYKKYKLKQLADKLGAEVREKETELRIKNVKYQDLLGEWFPSQPTVEEKIEQDAKAGKNSVQDRFVDGLTAIDQGRVLARENARVKCDDALQSLNRLELEIGSAQRSDLDHAVYTRIMQVGHDIKKFFNSDGDQALDSLAHCMARLDRCRDIIRRSYQIHEMLSTGGYGMTETLLHNAIGRKAGIQREKAMIIQRRWRQKIMTSREGQVTGSQPEEMSKKVLEQFAASIRGRVSTLDKDVVEAFSPSDRHRMPLQDVTSTLLQRLVTRSKDKYVQPHAAVDDPEEEQSLAERYAVILNQVEGYQKWFSVISDQIDGLRQSIDDLEYHAVGARESVTSIVRKLGVEPLDACREATSKVIDGVSREREGALPTLAEMIGRLSDYDVLRARTKNAQGSIERVTEQLKKYNSLIEKYNESKNLTLVVKALKSEYLDDMSTICSDSSNEDEAAQQFAELNAMADLSLSVLTLDDASINGYLQKLDGLEEVTEGTGYSDKTKARLNELFQSIAQNFREQFLSLLKWDDSTAAVTEHAEQLRKINEQVGKMINLRSDITKQFERIHSLGQQSLLAPVMQALEEKYLGDLCSVDVSNVRDSSSSQPDLAARMRTQHVRTKNVLDIEYRGIRLFFVVSDNFKQLDALRENKLGTDSFVKVVQALQQQYQQALVEAVRTGETSGVADVVRGNRPIVGMLKAYKKLMASQAKKLELRTSIGALSANTQYPSIDLQLPEVTLDDIKQGTESGKFKDIQERSNVIESELVTLEECCKCLREIQRILPSPAEQGTPEQNQRVNDLVAMRKKICISHWEKPPADLLTELHELHRRIVAFNHDCIYKAGASAANAMIGSISSVCLGLLARGGIFGQSPRRGVPARQYVGSVKARADQPTAERSGAPGGHTSR